MDIAPAYLVLTEQLRPGDVLYADFYDGYVVVEDIASDEFRERFEVYFYDDVDPVFTLTPTLHALVGRRVHVDLPEGAFT